MTRTISEKITKLAAGTIAIVMISVVGSQQLSVHQLLIDIHEGPLHVEWWRLFTGHMVHASSLHLFLNLLLFVPFGVLRERQVGTARFLLEYAALAAIVAAGVRLLHSDWETYCGLSGVVYGLITLVLLSSRTQKQSEGAAAGGTAHFRAAVVVLLAGKSLLEYFGRGWLLASDVLEPSLGVVYLPGSHCAGMLGGAFLAILWRQERLRDTISPVFS